MRSFLAKLLAFAVTKGLVIFVFAVGFAQIAKSALIEAKYGNFSYIIAWVLLIAVGVVPLVLILKKINK